MIIEKNNTIEKIEICYTDGTKKIIKKGSIIELDTPTNDSVCSTIEFCKCNDNDIMQIALSFLQMLGDLNILLDEEK